MYKNPIFLSLASVILLIAAVAGATRWRYGSITNAVAYFDGQSVIADQLSRDLGVIKCDDLTKVEFMLTNLNNSKVKLAGANCECSCVVPPKMPVVLAPFESTPVIFSFHAPPNAAAFETPIEIYFDGPISPLQLKIVGIAK